MLGRKIHLWSFLCVFFLLAGGRVAYGDGNGLQIRQTLSPEPGKIAALVEPEKGVLLGPSSADFSVFLNGSQSAPNVSVRKNSDRGGLLTLVVLDDSGSYRNTAGQTVARPTLHMYAKGLGAQDRIGLVVFGADAKLCPIRRLSSDFLSDLANPTQACGATPNNLRATNLLAGLLAALNQIRREQEEKRATAGLSEIVFFTDAGDEAAVSPDDWKNVQSLALSLGVRVSSVVSELQGKSGQQHLASLTRLRELSDKTNGVYDNSSQPQTAATVLQAARDKQRDWLVVEAALCGVKADAAQAGVDVRVEYGPGGQRMAWSGSQTSKPLWTAASEAPCPLLSICSPACSLWEQCRAGKCEPRQCVADEQCGPTTQCVVGRCVVQSVQRFPWHWVVPAGLAPLLLALLLLLLRRNKAERGTDSSKRSGTDAPPLTHKEDSQPTPAIPEQTVEQKHPGPAVGASVTPLLDPLPETHLVAIGGRITIGEKWRLHKSKVQVGGSSAKEDENDIVFSVPQVSSKHARFELYPSGALWITDLEARNGTYVNGRQLAKGERAALRPGDQIKLSSQVVLEVLRPGVEKSVPNPVQEVQQEVGPKVDAAPSASPTSDKKKTVFDPGNR